MASNPYSIQFGREPMENIVRASETYSVMRDFREESPRQQIYMITGVRGCGKTVFLTELTHRFQKEKDWIVIELSPEGDLLQKLASALASQNHLARIFQQARINLSFFGFGLEVAGSVPVSNIEVALTQMLASIKKHRQRVLVTIDEVTSYAGFCQCLPTLPAPRSSHFSSDDRSL